MYADVPILLIIGDSDFVTPEHAGRSARNVPRPAARRKRERPGYGIPARARSEEQVAADAARAAVLDRATGFWPP